MTMTMSVEMPDSFSIELRSLLTSLLQREVHKRLGCRGRGAEEVKSHPFFRGIDWRVVFLQRLSPPLIPARGEVNAADAFDIGSFDEEDTKHIKLTEADQELYRNFPVVVSERWQHEIAETIFDYINHEADKAEMKRKNKGHKLGYQEEEQSDCILHGYIKRLGGTFTATWLTRYVRLYPNRLELWSDSGKQPELIFMDQIEEVCNDYVQIKNEQCIVIKLYNHSKYVFTNSDEIGLKEWHISLKSAHRESVDMMTTMAEKATKIYGTEIPLKHMGKRRQQLQQEANQNSTIANLEQKTIQKELQASHSAASTVNLTSQTAAAPARAVAAADEQPTGQQQVQQSNLPKQRRSTSSRQSSLAETKAGKSGELHSHRRHHQHRVYHHRHHHHHEHTTGAAHHHHHHRSHRSAGRHQAAQETITCRASLAQNAQGQEAAGELAGAALDKLASKQTVVSNDSGRLTGDASSANSGQSGQTQVAEREKVAGEPLIESAGSVRATGNPEESAEGAKADSNTQTTDSEAMQGGDATQTKMETTEVEVEATKKDGKNINSSTSVDSGTSNSTRSSASCSSSSASADEDLPSEEHLAALETDRKSKSLDASSVQVEQKLSGDTPAVVEIGEQPKVGTNKVATNEEEKDGQQQVEPSGQVRMKLAVSLENVTENQQEVLRDPSKRITSDNRQRELDLVAQYEKLNIKERTSSSSIEEENG